MQAARIYEVIEVSCHESVEPVQSSLIERHLILPRFLRE